MVSYCSTIAEAFIKFVTSNRLSWPTVGLVDVQGTFVPREFASYSVNFFESVLVSILFPEED